METPEQKKLIEERRKAAMEADFYPSYTRYGAADYDARLAEAAEYIAHHIGKISKNLERIAAGYPSSKK